MVDVTTSVGLTLGDKIVQYVYNIIASVKPEVNMVKYFLLGKFPHSKVIMTGKRPSPAFTKVSLQVIDTSM